MRMSYATIGFCTGAMIAAGALFATNARSADLGGDCCADLETRVAELEATTVRKGNKKIKLTLSGSLSYAVLYGTTNVPDAEFGEFGEWDVVQNPNSGPSILFSGEGKITSTIKAGFVMEIAPKNNDGWNRVDAGVTYVYLDAATAGKISLGYQKAATDGTNSKQVVDISDVAGLFDISPLTHLTGLSGPPIFGKSDSIRYDNSDIGGSGISIGLSYDPEAKTIDAGATFAKKLGTIDVAAAAGYEDINSIVRVYGVSGGLRENTTGLFAQGGYTDAVPTLGTEFAAWHVQGGLAKNLTAMGDTVFYGEYGAISKGGPGHLYGFGVKQNLDAAATDVFAGYRMYSDDATGSATTVTTVIGGMTVKF